MIITAQRKEEIKKILLKGRPYFKKDESSPELEITFDSSERELVLAKRYIGRQLHPDALSRRTDLTEAEKKELIHLLSDVNSAIDDLVRLQRDKKPVDVDTEKDNNIKHTISTFISRFMYLPKNTIINYYDLFAINKTLTNDQILASNQYKVLCEALTLKNIELVEMDKRAVFERLVQTFNDFDKNVLKNKEGRYYYDRLLANSGKQEEPKKEEPKKEVPYKAEINKMLENYNRMLQENFVDYYILFNINRNQNRYQILNGATVTKLNQLLRPERFKDYQLPRALQKLFNSLCKTYEGFIKWTLSSDEKRNAYDAELAAFYKKSQGPKQTGAGNNGPKKTNKKQRKERVETEYRYIFAQTPVNPKEVVSLKMRNLYNALAQGIDDWGVSITVLMLNRLFQIQTIDAFEPEMIVLMQPYVSTKDIKELYDELLQKYPSSNTLELAEKIMNAMLSRKAQVLSNALTHTAERHGIPHTIHAVHKYISENDPGYISGGNETTMGREKVMMEMSPEFTKYVLASMDSSKLLLLDFPALLDDEYNDDESLNEIVREFIKPKRKGFRK